MDWMSPALELLEDIITVRQIKNVVPIISNSFYLNEVLGNETRIIDLSASSADNRGQGLTIDERLTKLWSQKIKYPLADGHKLPRVAQYYEVLKRAPDLAKEEYQEFLNEILLEINEDKQRNADEQKVFEQLKKDFEQKRKDGEILPFAETVAKLGYPKSLGDNDPLDKLANIQFSNYITTSYHDFLERALVKARREPITQFLFLDNTGIGTEIKAPILGVDGKEADPPDNLEGTPALPVVYHLFGLENYPSSLVIGEDDYLNFLVTAVTDTDTHHPMLPLKLGTILGGFHLLLLGYQLQDWDFRALFRLILQKKSKAPRPGIFMQVPPRQDTKALLDYVSRYFKNTHFDVIQKTPMKFTQELWSLWERDNG